MSSNGITSRNFLVFSAEIDFSGLHKVIQVVVSEKRF